MAFALSNKGDERKVAFAELTRTVQAILSSQKLDSLKSSLKPFFNWAPQQYCSSFQRFYFQFQSIDEVGRIEYLLITKYDKKTALDLLAILEANFSKTPSNIECGCQYSLLLLELSIDGFKSFFDKPGNFIFRLINL